MLNVTADNFNNEVESYLNPILIDFYADWCGPCRNMKPVLENLETELQGKLKIVKIESDNELELCVKFGVRSLPTFVLIINGHRHFKVGAISTGTLRDWISGLLKVIE